MRTHVLRSCKHPRELLRHNNVKRLMSYDIQPGNASAPQNQLQRCSWGIRPESETGDYTGGAVLMSSWAGRRPKTEGRVQSQNNHFNR